MNITTTPEEKAWKQTETAAVTPQLFYLFRQRAVHPNGTLPAALKPQYYHIFLVEAGTVTIEQYREQYTIGPDQLLVLGSEGLKGARMYGEQTQFWILGFSAKLLVQAGLPSGKGHLLFLHRRTLCLEKTEKKRLCELLAFLESLRSPDFLPSADLLGHAFGLLVYLLEALFRDRHGVEMRKMSRKEVLTLEFIRLLGLFFMEQRGVQFYANRLFVTTKYLARAVKETSGYTPRQLIEEKVVAEAKYLLEDLSLTVAHVSDRLHFSDPFSFSKYFKKGTRHSPSHYRSLL